MEYNRCIWKTGIIKEIGIIIEIGVRIGIQLRNFNLLLRQMTLSMFILSKKKHAKVYCFIIRRYTKQSGITSVKITLLLCHYVIQVSIMSIE